MAERLSGRLVCLLIVLAWALPAASQGQDDADLQLLSRRATTFLAEVSKQTDTSAAFETLLAGSDLASAEEMQGLVAAAGKLEDKYGVFVAAERVSARRFGPDLVLLTYLYKAERFPVVWRFAFYRPRESGRWAVVSLSLDSKLLQLAVEPPTATP